MDFAYSPHRETGGTMHLPSPTHHGYRIEGAHFSSSIQQLRRSLSRSPSKPSRFHLRTNKNDPAGSPISPLALSRAFSPKAIKSTSPISAAFESPFGSQAPQTAKKKFTLRRGAPFRASPRNRAPGQKSPRRALVDTDRGNVSPFVSRPLFGDENMPTRKNSIDLYDASDNEAINDRPIPIKFDIFQPPPQAAATPGANTFTPGPSSPRKRRDGFADVGSANTQTPNPKRRSLHGPDFSVFDQTPGARAAAEEFPQTPIAFPGTPFATPMPVMQSPLRRATSLKRPGPNHAAEASPRSKPFMDGDFVKPGQAASKTRQRASMDGFTFSTPVQSDFARPSMNPPPVRNWAGNSTRHPLANAVTASPSIGSHSPADSPVPPTPAPRVMPFSKSLPLGAARPQPFSLSGEGTFQTPFAIGKFTKNPLAQSTGVLAKKNRDVNSPKADNYQMPDTPLKRQSFPPSLGVESPLAGGRLSFQDKLQKSHASDRPNPFAPESNNSPFGFSSLFGSSAGSAHHRRASAASFEGSDDDISTSPSADRMIDHQSTTDDMPPTPTKHGDGAGRRSKDSSLRRRTFPRPGRGVIAQNTFIAPDQFDPSGMDMSTSLSPHTPNESSFTPPDASRLTISGPHRTSFSGFANSFPPATPTTPSGHSAWRLGAQTDAPIGLPKNDVDESLFERFEHVEKLKGAEGEFSQVYKARPRFAPSKHTFAVVKKSKKPFTGDNNKARKLREAEILRTLRGNEHIVEYQDHWIHGAHLYIQTEWCDNGNLKDYLNKSRLDDFRIWKIALDLSLGLKFIHDSGIIHLDLKPANVLVDFGCWVKIADFGLASYWPAPPGIDGEGDRAYLAPEALQGRFDKPADVFALGIILAEIAGDVEIPEYGDSWQNLRSGSFNEVLPSLSFSKEGSTLSRDENGDPIEVPADNDLAASLQAQYEEQELAKAPEFMTNNQHPCAMDQIVKSMLHPDPDCRPTAELVATSYGCQWTAERRRFGSLMFEGNFGPHDDTLDCGEPMITDYGDAMDTS